MAFASSSEGGPRTDINITPLVDVVLVLLIIFMVMTPTLLKQLDLTVPEKADVQVATPTTDQIVVSISREGQIALNKEPITQPTLIERMQELMRSNRQKLVFFDIDDDANYGEVVHVVDIVRGCGAKTLGIMTK